MYRTTGYPIDLEQRARARAQRRGPGRLSRVRALAARLGVLDRRAA
jgi:hypothetical protein